MSRAEELRQTGKKIYADDILGALNCFSEAMELAESAEDLRLQLELNLELCLIHRNLSNMKEGFSSAVKAASLAQLLLDQESVVRAYNFMGIFCFYNGLYKRAMHYFYYGLERGSSIKTVSLMSSLYTNLGETYLSIGNLEESLKCLVSAYDIVRAGEFEAYYTPILSNIGNVYLKMGLLEKAESYFKEALAFQTSSQDNLYCAELDYRMGVLCLQRGDAKQAYDYFRISESKYRKINNRFYLIDVLVKISELEDIVDQEARNVILNEAKLLALETMAQNKMSTIEFKLHEFALKKDNYKEALHHYKAYHDYSSKSDAKNLLAKLEIMSIEQDFRIDIGGEIDLKDFANMDIFGDYDVEEIIESLKKDLHYKAHTDDLTGLPNRRKINAKLNEITAPAEGMAHGFLLIDIDHFKLVNDSEGHLYGDRCLMRVAKVIKEWAFDANGFAGRYGGEEFLCILENLSKEDLLHHAEQIRERIEGEAIKYNIEKELRYLTVSIGCSLVEHHSENDIFKILETADRSLYMAKMAGRNRVMMTV